mmetsp:Transcript_47153/g.109018  ORF Transcript_47153/g.109018 Transcript_47153/m.109018 type:complete len:85 (-) Transcript_47153:424-678(-)
MATPCKHLADRVQQLPVSPRSLSAGSARLQMPPSRLLRPGHHKRPEVTAVKACGLSALPLLKPSQGNQRAGSALHKPWGWHRRL